MGGIGQISQKRAAFLLKALPLPGMSVWRLRVRGRLRRASSSSAALSILRIELARHEARLHRASSAPVLPILAILLPHAGQCGAAMRDLAVSRSSYAENRMLWLLKRRDRYTHSAQVESWGHYLGRS